MNITNFKTSLFGYKKSDVFEYIAQMNEEFTQKLLEAVQEHDRLIQSLNDKIFQLQEENSTYRAERDRVTSILTDAKVFASDLRARAAAEDERIRQEAEEYTEKQKKRIDEYCNGIDEIQTRIRDFLSTVERELAEKKDGLLQIRERIQVDGEGAEEDEEKHE